MELPINLDTILSDPILLVGVTLLVLAPLTFLIAVIQFFRAPKKRQDFLIPASSPDEPVEESSPLPNTPPEPLIRKSSPLPVTPEPSPAAEPVVEAAPIRQRESAAEKTMVMPQGMGEIQGQVEILFTQIKMLNKKVFEVESGMNSLAKVAGSKLEPNELKEMPANANDFAQKLLKLAEHVIALEKEVAQLKNSAPPAPKPPIMPI